MDTTPRTTRKPTPKSGATAPRRRVKAAPGSSIESGPDPEGRDAPVVLSPSSAGSSPLPDVTLFADGACSGNPGPGGWGAILISSPGGKRLEISGADPDTTNNRMELIGVIEALRRLKMKSRVRVVTDSRYVVDGMKSWIHAWRRNGWHTADKKPVKNRDLWELLGDLAREHETTFEWIRGHEGHAENERCDELARSAIETARTISAGPRRPARH